MCGEQKLDSQQDREWVFRRSNVLCGDPFSFRMAKLLQVWWVTEQGGVNSYGYINNADNVALSQRCLTRFGRVKWSPAL